MGNGIGWAVHAMREGVKVRRAVWNGTRAYIQLVPNGAGPKEARVPDIGMYTERGVWHPEWACTPTDLLAMDWEVAV